MRIMNGLALLAFGFSSLGAATPAPVKEWTLLTFINGNNNLDSFGAMNINQMEEVGSTASVNVVVQWASYRAATVKRLLVKKDASSAVTSPVLQDMGKVDMGDWRTLVEFIRWGVENFPAKHYMVNVWDHGSGWHLKRLRAAGDIHANDISWDDFTGHSITTEQLGEAMREAKRVIGHNVDVYGSDACLMAMVEVAGEMADAVDTFVGSQDLEPGAGWPYSTFLRRWNAKASNTPAEVVTYLVQEYLKSYQGGINGKSEVTLSAFDLTKLGALQTSMRGFSQTLQSLDATGRRSITNAIKQSQNFYYSDYGDLIDFLAQSEKAGVSGLTRETVQKVRDAARDFVIANGVTQSFAKATGISIWLPENQSALRSYEGRYQGLLFSRATGWGDALKHILMEAAL